jgi:hypothetical protein
MTGPTSSISKSVTKSMPKSPTKGDKDKEEDDSPAKTYTRMMQDLEFPTNPAFYKSGPGTKAVPAKETKAMKESFLEICRLQNIPFNKADALLYRL